MGRDLKRPENKRATSSEEKNCVTCKYWLGSKTHDGKWWRFTCTRDRLHIKPSDAMTTICDGWSKYRGTRDI